MLSALSLLSARLVRFALLLCLFARASAADLSTWPGQYKIAPWESSRLTAADVVGPDGIVYPDFTGVGVTGGIPDVNNATIRDTYTEFNVQNYGATGNDTTNDDAAVASAATAARNHLNANVANKAILYFPAGTYYLDTPVTFTHSNLVIDGDGPASTIIKLATDTTQSGALFSLIKPAAFTGYLTVTAFAPRGANTVTLSANPATNTFAIGSWFRIHQTSTSQTKTISTRFSNPDNAVYFTDGYFHTPRLTYAKVIAIDATAKTLTFDRTLTHDLFVDDLAQLRRMDMMEYSGIQDLAIETVAATATVNPVKFEGTANCWIKNFKTIKARDWPIYTTTVTRLEIRDSQFLGTWKDITLGGGTAYLGWCEPATDSLMENVQASDLRHMGIFMFANRCVIRNSTFTGRSVQSPQLHGRFPHDNLIEGSTFNHVGSGGTSSRGVTFYGSDGGYSMDHGANGPRNVYYNNQVLAGMGSANFSGISEGFIFVYNRILKNEDTEAKPAFLVQDRTFDFTLRGNIFQSITSLPALSFNESTCTGWDVTDNTFHGTNGHLYEGDSAPALAHNNRFLPIATAPASATTPEVASIYDWQRTYANTARLVVVAERRTVTDTGGTTTAIVTRVKASTDSALTVTLSPDIAGLSFPASVVIPAGQTSATFTITGVPVSGGEKLVTLTASASGLLSDIEKISVLDQDVAQPNFGGNKWPIAATGLPTNWKAGNYGVVTAAGSQSYNSGSATWTITGAGLTTETFHGSLTRSGRKFVYQTVDGDGEIRARITAATGEQQAGLMMADDEATHTDFIWVEPNGRVFSSSNTPDSGLGNGVPTQRVAAGTKIVPCWLRLKRVGSTFTAYRSTVTAPATEADWTVLATVNFYPVSTGNVKSPAILDQRMHYGMFINSGSASTTGTASFTGVALTGTIIPISTPPEDPEPPVVSPAQSAAGTVGAAFTYDLQASNSPASFALASGSLPPGLTLDSATGRLSGTPSANGTFTPAFTATNASGTSPAVVVTLTIAPAATDLLILAEPFAYAVPLNAPDPDGGVNGNNGLPATNVGGTPSGTSTGLYGSWGATLDTTTGLAYSQGPYTLVTSGAAGAPNNATWGGDPRFYRNMTVDPFLSRRVGGVNNGAFGVNGQTLYVSILARTSASSGSAWRLNLAGSGRNVFLENTATGWSLNENASGPVATTATLTLNQTTLLVVRIDFVAGAGDVFRLWVDPTLDQALGSHHATLSTTVDFGGLASFSPRPAALGTMILDELRVGTSFNSVTPVVTPQAQSITFNPLPAKTYGDAAFTLTGSASSGLPVSYTSSDETVATVAGNLVTILRAGETTFTASQAGNTTYSAATPVSRVLIVTSPPLAVFRHTYGLAADGSQDTVTPAGDGVPNLLKYAFNMLGSDAGQTPDLSTPNAAILAPDGSAGLPFCSLLPAPGSTLQITYIRRKATAYPGVNYTVEWSDTLVAWAADPSATETATSLDATFERVTATDSAPAGTRRFVRVKVAAQ
ncbi:MAG: putative Ig domain-containing protein [Burkholderiales bacterium]|nr:putative Ig domain-containing protein [Opitutaceae bacterium]